MDRFLSMIVLMIIYFIAASSNGKKKKKKKAARARGFQTAFDAAGPSSDERRMKKPERALEGRQTSFAADCESRPIHLHDVPQNVMQRAGEGEDPCHAGGVDAKRRQTEDAEASSAVFYSSETEGGEIAQDVLRGVIMSEILTRPCDRRAIQRNRRNV